MTTPCTEYRPDHNGECLLCDEPLDAHTPEAQIAGLTTELDLRRDEIKDLHARLMDLQQRLDEKE